MNRVAALLEKCREKKLLKDDADVKEYSFLFLGMVQNAAIYFALSEYKIKPISHYASFWDIFLWAVAR